jgi:hypothetical protein
VSHLVQRKKRRGHRGFRNFLAHSHWGLLNRFQRRAHDCKVVGRLVLGGLHHGYRLERIAA